MSYSLRRRLTKRNARSDLKDATKTQSPLKDSSDDASNPENDTTKPPINSPAPSPPAPPKAMLASTSTIRRVSPSPSLLDKYKTRAPASSAPQTVTPSEEIETPTKPESTFLHTSGDPAASALTPPDNTAPADEAVSGTLPKATWSFEALGPDSTRDNARESASNTPEVPSKDEDFVEGEHFTTGRISKTLPSSDKGSDAVQHSNSTVEQEVVSPTDEGCHPRFADNVSWSKRRTRAQRRRQERADSATDDLTLAGKESVGSSKGSEVVPAGLTIRKRRSGSAGSRKTPSPEKKDIDEKKHDELAIITPCKTNATPFNSPRKPSEDHERDELAASDCNSIPDSTTHITEESTTHISDEDLPEEQPAALTTLYRSTVKVTPPTFDPTYSALHQWTDTRASSSRPEHIWGWMKKWTCCHCKALTIVEQESCAKIVCGHVRCKRECKLVHVA